MRVRLAGNSYPNLVDLTPTGNTNFAAVQVPAGATAILGSRFQPISSLVTVEDAPQPMEL